MRFVNGITSQIFLTRSSLPPSYPDYKSKSDRFQSKTTRLIRKWKGFTPLVNRLAVENVLQGYTYAVFMDPDSWKPKAFKQDRAYVPEESEQHAHELQFFVCKQDYILSDFIKLFVDEEAARANGYDLENCNWAAASAPVKDPRDDAQTTQFRKFQEMLVDGTLGLTYAFSSPRVVKTWLLWNQEYDGSVSFWMMERDSGKLLRFSKKIYKDMSEVVAVLTLDPGNGSIHSSLGLGRYLAAQAVVVERHRNRMLDNTMMAGLLILRADAKDRNRANTQVASPFVFIDKSIEIGEQQFEANSEGYIAADNLITSWAEQLAGVYVQAQIQANGASDKTATEASIDAAREHELGDVVMKRWLDQSCDMVQIMQERIYTDDRLEEAQRLWEKIQENPDLNRRKEYAKASDPDVIEVIVEQLQEGTTVDELKVIRVNPASGFSHVDVAVIQQGINEIAVQYKGDPRLDQNKLLRLDVESKVGPDVARDLVIENEDSNVVQGGVRDQMTETNTMNGLFAPQPVLPKDNDAAHVSVLIPLLKTMAKDLADINITVVQLKHLELNVNHLGDHLQAMELKGQKNTPLFKGASQFYAELKKDIARVIEVQQHAQIAAQAVMQKIRQEQAGGPGAVTAPPQAPAGPPQLPAGQGAPAPAAPQPDEQPHYERRPTGHFIIAAERLRDLPGSAPGVPANVTLGAPGERTAPAGARATAGHRSAARRIPEGDAIAGIRPVHPDDPDDSAIARIGGPHRGSDGG